MGNVIAGMTMSLDGFVADADGNVDLLYADLAELQETSYMTAPIAETGAVLMGGGRSRRATPTRMSALTSSRFPSSC